MTDFKPGDRVSITIEEAVVTNTFATSRQESVGGPVMNTGTVLVFRHPGDDDRMDRSHTVNMGAKGVTVTRVAPAEWPPQPGDLWRGADDRLWFAVVDPTPYENPLGVKLVSADGDSLFQNALGNGSGCTLVRREDQEADR